MAKQTFTTGQVLTAAQMTNLQQTAMGGGSPVTKTASYVLVAADAGTVIQMNSASSTTITVNTALFAAGDSVQIQNIGAGVCTVTAGTATVTTAGSLALTQWEGGNLYFTSTSAAIFFDIIQAGASIPLTTKGDLFGFDTANARIPVGTNNQVLTADSTQALGVKWATPSAAASGLTLIKTQTIGSAVSSVTVTSAFSSTYDNYLVTVTDGVASNSSSYLNLILGSTSSGYSYSGMLMAFNSNTITGSSQNAGAAMFGGYFSTNALSSQIIIQNPNLAKRTVFMTDTIAAAASNYVASYKGFLDDATQYTAFTLTTTSGTLTGGTIRVYGYQNS